MYIYIYTYTFVISYLVCKYYMDMHVPPQLHGFEDSKQHLMKNLWFGYTLLLMCSYLCCMPRDSPFSWRRCPESENWCCLTCRNSESPIQRSEVFTSLYWFLKVRDTAPPSPALVGGASPWIRHGWGTPQLSLQGQSRGLCFRSRKSRLWMVMVSSFGDRGWCWWPFLGWWCFGA